MKLYTIELADELAASVDRAARQDMRTAEAYIAKALELLMFGYGANMPPITAAELERYRKERAPRSPIKAALKNKIFERDGGKCRHCGGQILYDEPWHIDHLLAVSNGGTNDEANLALSCVACNLEKGAK